MTAHSSLSSPLNEAVASIVGDEGFTYWFIDGEQPDMNRAFMCREAAEAAAQKAGKSKVVPLAEYRLYQTDMNECLWAIERVLAQRSDFGFCLLHEPTKRGTDRWVAQFSHPLYPGGSICGHGDVATLAICRAIIAMGCRLQLQEDSPDVHAIARMIVTHLVDSERLRVLFDRVPDLTPDEQLEFAELVESMHGQCTYPREVLVYMDSLVARTASH